MNGLEFDYFGCGLTHMRLDAEAEQHEVCPNCDGRKVVGGALQIACPTCGMTGRITK